MLWQFRSLFSGELSEMEMAETLIQLAARVFVLLFCLSAHEFAHGWMAKKLGDKTAMMRGRLTLNPAKHLDPVGTIMILLVGFGYAKPVPVQPRFFKNVKKGMALTAAAGPAMNLILAFFLLLLGQAFAVVTSLTGIMDPDMINLMWLFFVYSARMNIGLMIFNLLPIPPLDGSRILDMFLPMRASMFLDRYERYLTFAPIVVAVLLASPISALNHWITTGLNFLAGLPFFWVEALL